VRRGVGQLAKNKGFRMWRKKAGNAGREGSGKRKPGKKPASKLGTRRMPLGGAVPLTRSTRKERPMTEITKGGAFQSETQEWKGGGATSEIRVCLPKRMAGGNHQLSAKRNSQGVDKVLRGGRLRWGSHKNCSSQGEETKGEKTREGFPRESEEA